MKPNDKVCTETEQDKEKELPLRTSRIIKGIKRTLNTAAYESIVIEDAIEEEITWKTPEERMRKIQNWETVFLDEFKKSHDRILEELGLSHKKAYFKKVSPETVNRYVPSSGDSPKNNLDDFDVLNIG